MAARFYTNNHMAVTLSLKCLITNDCYLLENEVNERSQTHKLAEYLQLYLPEWNVDCEYNKNINRPKELNFSQIVNDIRNTVSQADNDESNLSLELENWENKQIYDESGALSFLKFSSKEIGNGYVKRVFPDIIAHLRGTSNNKIVVEAKRSGNPDKKARLFDIVKLALFTQRGGQYGYKTGYFIELPKIIPRTYHISVARCDEKIIERIRHNVYMVAIT